MKLSATEIISDGFTRDYAFSFVGEDKGYLRDSDLLVTVDGVPVQFALTSPNTLLLEDTPEEGKVILIRRVMPKDRTYADFRKGNNFREQVINNSFLQTLYTIHELLDGYFSGKVEFQDDVIFLNDLVIKGQAMFESDLSVEGSSSVGGDLEVLGKIVADLVVSGSDPEDPHSVVNFAEGDLRYVATGGDDLSGLYRVLQKLQVLNPTPSDPLSVMNVQASDARYLPRTGGQINGLVTLLAGALVSQVGEDPRSVISRSFADQRFLRRVGGSLLGELDARSGSIRVRNPLDQDEPVPKALLESTESRLDSRIDQTNTSLNDKLDETVEAIQSGDFFVNPNAPVVWHKRRLSGVVLVPADSEARTFGGKFTVEEGGLVSIGEGSVWKFIK